MKMATRPKAVILGKTDEKKKGGGDVGIILTQQNGETLNAR